MTRLETLLSQLEAQARIMRAAVEDEREGDAFRAASYIYQDASALWELVTSW